MIDFRANRTAHAGLLLCFMSPEAAAAFPDQAKALLAGFQDLYQHPTTVDDVHHYPSVGRNSYTAEEVKWLEATYEFLEGQLGVAKRAKRQETSQARSVRRRRRRRRRRPQHAFSGGGGANEDNARSACADDTEDEDEPSLVTPSSRKRGRKPR